MFLNNGKSASVGIFFIGTELLVIDSILVFHGIFVCNLNLVLTSHCFPPRCARELQMTSKTDVFAFGVVLAELVTGQRALIRNNQEPNKMKSLVSVVSSQLMMILTHCCQMGT